MGCTIYPFFNVKISRKNFLLKSRRQTLLPPSYLRLTWKNKKNLTLYFPVLPSLMKVNSIYGTENIPYYQRFTLMQWQSTVKSFLHYKLLSLNLCIPVAISSLLQKTEHDCTDSITLEKNAGHSHSSKYVVGIYARYFNHIWIMK